MTENMFENDRHVFRWKSNFCEKELVYYILK